MNPYPKPAPGSYRSLIIEGLETMEGMDEVISSVRDNEILLAIASSITGNPTLFPSMAPLFIKALEKVPESDTRNYYIHGLGSGQIVPASPKGCFVYSGDDAQAKAFVEKMLREIAKEHFGPEDLYFK